MKKNQFFILAILMSLFILPLTTSAKYTQTITYSISVETPKDEIENMDVGEDSFSAPRAGVYFIRVKGADGGEGTIAGSNPDKGGKGGTIEGCIKLEKDEVLTFNIGGAGKAVTAIVSNSVAGGANGGGKGAGSRSSAGGGGGGRTDIMKSNGTKIMVAAGGGGGGYGANGGAGGTGSFSEAGISNGKAGTNTTFGGQKGGAGGTNAGPGTDGNGLNAESYGGGGGAGYKGGGGGQGSWVSGGSGGGGGSSYMDPTAVVPLPSAIQSKVNIPPLPTSADGYVFIIYVGQVLPPDNPSNFTRSIDLDETENREEREAADIDEKESTNSQEIPVIKEEQAPLQTEKQKIKDSEASPELVTKEQEPVVSEP